MSALGGSPARCGAWTRALPALLALALPRPAAAVELELATGHRVFGTSLPEEILASQLLRFPTRETSDRLAYQAWILAALSARPLDALGLRLGIDSGLFDVGADGASGDGLPILEHLQATALLGEAAAELQLLEGGALELELGRIRRVLGADALYEGYGFFASADLDLTYLDDPLPLRSLVLAGLPDGRFATDEGRHPLVLAELGYQSESTRVLALAALYFDTGDGLASLLTEAVVTSRLRRAVRSVERRAALPLARAVRTAFAAGVLNYEIDTAGHVGWAGLRFSHEGELGYVRGVGLFGFGRLTLDVRPGQELAALADRFDAGGPARAALLAETHERIGIRAGLALVEGGLAATEALTLTAVAMFVSPEDGDLSASAPYTAFISLSPRVPHGAIFFQGGLAEVQASSSLVALAPDAAGLVAAGLGAELTIAERAELRLELLTFVGLEANLTGGRWFGLEADLGGAVELGHGLLATLDLAAFRPGDYYGDGLALAFQATAGITWSWSST